MQSTKMNTKGSNFFGLFGSCNDSIPIATTTTTKEDPLEEGQIDDDCDDQLSSMPPVNEVSFDSLLSQYQTELANKQNLVNSKLCSICTSIEYKYKCPKCCMKTCSLKCCLEHKKVNNCDGVREQTSFVPLKDYSQQHFTSG